MTSPRAPSDEAFRKMIGGVRSPLHAFVVIRVHLWLREAMPNKIVLLLAVVLAGCAQPEGPRKLRFALIPKA
ncbi:MAG: hypothetical protein U0802_11680, partial [Candidatus Binatia bacterium]